jgi:AFG3 family protein
VSFYDSKGQNEYGFSKPYSEATSQMIDEEVRIIIDNAYTRTKELLTERRHELEVIAKELLEKEVLLQDDLERLVGKRPFGGQTNYQAHMAGTDRSETASEVKGENVGAKIGSDLPELHLPGQAEVEPA